jgi:hypothetical protein
VPRALSGSAEPHNWRDGEIGGGYRFDRTRVGGSLPAFCASSDLKLRACRKTRVDFSFQQLWFGERTDLSLAVVIGEGNTPYPGDYRTKEQVLADAQKDRQSEKSE